MYLHLRVRLGAFLLMCGSFQGLAHGEGVENADWLSYGGNEQGHKFSSLTQINRGNVANLEVAWVQHHGDMQRGGHRMIGYETTPLCIEGILYFTTPFGRVVAVDGRTAAALGDAPIAFSLPD